MGGEGMPEDTKGPGRGRGKFTAAGVQAQQAADLEALKDVVVQLTADLEELDGRVAVLEGSV